MPECYLYVTFLFSSLQIVALFILPPPLLRFSFGRDLVYFPYDHDHVLSR